MQACATAEERRLQKLADIEEYIQEFERLQVIELCEIHDREEAFNRATYTDMRKIIAVSQELERRGMDPLACRRN